MKRRVLNNDEIKELCKKMRLHAISMAFSAGKRGAHISGSLSCIEIYAVLYGRIINYDIENKHWENRDRFIAGKEHARLAEYPVMAEMGFFPTGALNSYEENDGLLVGHQRNLDLGFEYSSLSLGMGLSFAVGKAIYAKQTNSSYRIYSLLGDAECNEGSIWEAILSAGNLNLDNLTIIIDRNYMSVDGNEENITVSQLDMESKMKAFGWESRTIDGHNINELIDAFEYHPEGKPYAIIAKTIKGKGVSFIENNKSWHQAILSEEQYKQAYNEILNQ